MRMNNRSKAYWITYKDGRRVCRLDHNGKRLGVRVTDPTMEQSIPEFLRILNAMMDIANKEAN